MSELQKNKTKAKGCWIDFKEFSLLLLPEKALWIKELNILLIADLHFGKAAHFRKSGIPIPEPIHRADFQKLEKLHNELKPSDTYFLGDLFHSDWNEQWEQLNTFLKVFDQTRFHLVKGNHDILPTFLYGQSVMKVHQEPLIIESFALSHEPIENSEGGHLNVCGHIHPGIFLRGKARQSVRIPCFYWSSHTLILPSFGNFTGLALISRKEKDKVWGISGEKVIPILSGTSIG